MGRSERCLSVVGSLLFGPGLLLWPFSDLVFGPAPFRFILVQLRSFVSGVDPWLCPFSGIDVGFAPILL